MVVPQNRRSFLALIRNVAVATGLVAAAPITALANENPNRLPVLKLETIREWHALGGVILNFEELIKFARDITTNPSMIKYEVIQYSILVWLPKTNQRVNSSDAFGLTTCYGEMDLQFRGLKKNGKEEYSAFHILNTKNTIIEPMAGNVHRYLKLKTSTFSSV